jgi:hypothetical protein
LIFSKLPLEFLRQSRIVRERCPHVRIVIDPQFVWNKAIADQITNLSTGQAITQSLVKFMFSSEVDGMGIKVYCLKIVFKLNLKDNFILHNISFFIL